jgi:hypothetical protein
MQGKTVYRHKKLAGNEISYRASLIFNLLKQRCILEKRKITAIWPPVYLLFVRTGMKPQGLKIDHKNIQH